MQRPCDPCPCLGTEDSWVRHEETYKRQHRMCCCCNGREHWGGGGGGNASGSMTQAGVNGHKPRQGCRVCCPQTVQGPNNTFLLVVVHFSFLVISKPKISQHFCKKKKIPPWSVWPPFTPWFARNSFSQFLSHFAGLYSPSFLVAFLVDGFALIPLLYTVFIARKQYILCSCTYVLVAALFLKWGGNVAMDDVFAVISTFLPTTFAKQPYLKICTE